MKNETDFNNLSNRIKKKNLHFQSQVKANKPPPFNWTKTRCMRLNFHNPDSKFLIKESTKAYGKFYQRNETKTIYSTAAAKAREQN